MAKKKSTHVMAILSESGFAYLTRQAKAVEQKGGGVGCKLGSPGMCAG